MDTGMSGQLSDVLARHGQRWTIAQDPDTGVWTAIERPTPTSFRIRVAHTLAQLDGKLDETAGDAP